MREVVVKIYSLDELDEEIRKRVLIDAANINVDYNWWDVDGLLDLSVKEMEERGIEFEEIKDVLFSYKIKSFNLDRNQYIQMVDIVVNNENVFRKFLKVPKDLWDRCDYRFYNTPGNLNTRFEFVNCVGLHFEEISEEGEKTLGRAERIMENKFYEVLKILRSDYEYLTSDEAVKDTINSNEYEFYEDGRMF